MRYTFQKHYYGGQYKYVCSCGHKFKRMNRDWFTVNPFNSKSFDECMRDGEAKMAVKERDCPKCGAKVKP